MKKSTFVILGCVAVILGAVGVVLPGLPTTPFLLLASWFFYRSSPKLQSWLLNSWLGEYIKNYHKQGGMTRIQKAGAVGMMTAMVLISTIFMIPDESVAKIIVPIAGVIGAGVVICVVPNANKRNEE